MSTQVTVHREQRFTNCFNVHDAGNEMGLLIKNIESVYGQQISLDEQVLPCEPPSYASQGPSRHILILRPLHPQSKKSDREKAVVEDKLRRTTAELQQLRQHQMAQVADDPSTIIQELGHNKTLMEKINRTHTMLKDAAKEVASKLAQLEARSLI